MTIDEKIPRSIRIEFHLHCICGVRDPEARAGLLEIVKLRFVQQSFGVLDHTLMTRVCKFGDLFSRDSTCEPYKQKCWEYEIDN